MVQMRTFRLWERRSLPRKSLALGSRVVGFHSACEVALSYTTPSSVITMQSGRGITTDSKPCSTAEAECEEIAVVSG